MSPDSKRLTAFSKDGFLHIFDLVNARQLGKVANAVGTENPARTESIFDRLAATQGVSATRGPVYSPDGKTLMLVGSSRVLQFVDLANAKEVGPSLGHIVSLTSAWFTPDGRHLLLTDSKTTRKWDTVTSKELEVLTLKLPTQPKLPTALRNSAIFSDDYRVGATVVSMATPPPWAPVAQRRLLLFDPRHRKDPRRDRP